MTVRVQYRDFDLTTELARLRIGRPETGALGGASDRIGQLRTCHRIVLTAVAARHRGEAFAACEFVMD